MIMYARKQQSPILSDTSQAQTLVAENRDHFEFAAERLDIVTQRRKQPVVTILDLRYFALRLLQCLRDLDLILAGELPHFAQTHVEQLALDPPVYGSPLFIAQPALVANFRPPLGGHVSSSPVTRLT